jgi:hypothetical protein
MTVRKLVNKAVAGTAGTYVGRTGEIFYDPAATNLRISNGSTAGGLSIGGNVQGVHGCFHKVADVVATEANTAFSFDWFTDVTQHVGDAGVTVTADQPTRLNISTAGNYLVTLEMLVRTTGNAPRDVFLWLSKNGNDIAETCAKVEVRQGSEVTPVYELISKQWLIHDIAANNYIELRFAVSRIDLMKLEYTAAQTTPYVRPAIPSAIITVAQI